MPIKTFKSYTPTRRFLTVEDFSDITKTEPEKSLIVPLKKTGGRNNTGELTVRHIGGGHKRYYRIIDFKRDKYDVEGTVVAIEYDPNRSARIALVEYTDGEKRYIIQPLGLKVGDKIISSKNAVEHSVGNAMPLKYIQVGTLIHNIEIYPGSGGKICRSAGSCAQLLAKEGEYANVKLQSGEVRKLKLDCMATIGQVGNIDHINVSLGKAGRSRHIGIRPTVRGVKMNAVDHPHGGGRGRSKGGNIPSSPTGVCAKGGKTRRKRNVWTKFIIQRRKK
ncbi:MAG: 50S ribosomal protein L2 [Endomicrobia bacterium]|nr:50S ribosomal protein L2 [Endomicrobiia bacterium]